MTNKIIIIRDINGVERVEKIISLNPDIYDWKDFYLMLDCYSSYCYKCGELDTQNTKTFKEWLDTEI